MSKNTKNVNSKTRKANNTKKTEKKYFNVTVTILVFIVIIAFFTIYYQKAVNVSKIGYISLEPINTTLSSNGTDHSLYIKFVLGIETKQQKKLNMQNVQEVTISIVENLDYSQIILENGTEYIKSFVLEQLRASFGDSIQIVNIDNILNDVRVSGM